MESSFLMKADTNIKRSILSASKELLFSRQGLQSKEGSLEKLASQYDVRWSGKNIGKIISTIDKAEHISNDYMSQESNVLLNKM